MPDKNRSWILMLVVTVPLALCACASSGPWMGSTSSADSRSAARAVRDIYQSAVQQPSASVALVHSDTLVCRPDYAGEGKATPFTLTVDNNGMPTSVVGKPLKERTFAVEVPMPRSLFLSMINTKGVHALRVQIVATRPDEWYVFVGPDGRYFEGLWIAGSGNPQDLVLIAPPGKCTAS